MNLLDIEEWLAQRSESRQETASEVIFTHFSGETSVLALPGKSIVPVLETKCSQLNEFFKRHAAASIGGSQIMIGTNIVDGYSISHGYRMFDLRQMRERVVQLGIKPGENEQVFMVEAAWMFAYTMAEEQGKTLFRRYDRDYKTVEIVEVIFTVFEDWWALVMGDSN